MKKSILLTLVALCSMGMGAQNWEAVHMFVAPEALWAEWSHDYTLKVSLKRWNGDDAETDNWDQYTFTKSDAVYNNQAVYFGDVWICWGGFAQMTFDAYNGDTKVLDSYTFWPPETMDGHWIEKAAFENKVFYGWNVTDYPPADFPFISSTAGNRIWFDNSKTQWEHVYVRIGRDELTGAGNYAATWPMTQLEGTNLWYVDSEAWENALVWVITNYNGNNGEYSVYDIPAGAERLYYCNYSITERVLPIVDGDAPATDDVGVKYWAYHNIPFFTRDGLSVGDYGTVCLPMGSPQFAGAEFFRVAGKELNTNNEPYGIVIETVNSIDPGVPYIFRATAEIMVLYNDGDYAEEPDNSQSNGLIGSYEEKDIVDDPNHFILKENKLYQVNQSKVGAYRAYFDFSLMSEFDESAASGACRRMNINGAQVPTAIDQITKDGQNAKKVLRDGQLIILYQDKQFNAQGAQLY